MPVPSVTLTGTAVSGVPVSLEQFHAASLLPTLVKLGRRPPLRTGPRLLQLASYLDLSRVQAPASVDYYTKAAASISRVYLNDQYGDCVIAGKYHTVGVWSANDTPGTVLGTDAEVYQAYQQICGPGDNGCVITEVLDAMKAQGLKFGGVAHKIDGYVACDWTNKELVKAAIYLFGSGSLGIDLPADWTSGAVWDVTNSRIVGGHDVSCVGYNEQGVQISSWGRVYTITWAAFTSRRWLGEMWVLLGPDWYNADNLSPGGVSVQALKDDLAQIGGGHVPDPPPPPPPPNTLKQIIDRVFDLVIAQAYWFQKPFLVFVKGLIDRWLDAHPGAAAPLEHPAFAALAHTLGWPLPVPPQVVKLILDGILAALMSAYPAFSWAIQAAKTILDAWLDSQR